VIPFRVAFKPGASLYEQVVYAAKKALVSGQLPAHKVITQLLNEGLLEVRPGTGTAVAVRGESTAAECSKLLDHEVEQLVVEAKKLSMSLEEVTGALAAHWHRLEPENQAPGPENQGGRKNR
jgi:GntR family transcriptional regulator